MKMKTAECGMAKPLHYGISMLCWCLFILTLAFSLRASGQNYSIAWYKIAGGGGTSTGATYQVTGTIGQPDASGAMTGGNYSLTGGFWSLISVVQTSGAPTLYIGQSGNTVTVFWQNCRAGACSRTPTSPSPPAGPPTAV